jgi:hypothetical protein
MAFLCYLLAILVIAAVAAVYLLTPKLLDYQEVAIGTSWDSLQPGMKTQFLSLLKVGGGGYLMTAAALAVLLFIPFQRGEAWAHWAIPAIGIPAMLIVNYAGLTIIQNTPGRPPLLAGPIVVALMLSGLFLSMQRSPSHHP